MIRTFANSLSFLLVTLFCLGTAHAQAASTEHAPADHADDAVHANATDHTADANSEHDGGHGHGAHVEIPMKLSSYKPLEAKAAAEKGAELSLIEVLKLRAAADPLNWIATLLFLGAILHTFAAAPIMKLAHKIEHEHQHDIASCKKRYVEGKSPVSFKATVLHFLGEVEAIFGIWLLPLIIAIFVTYGERWHAVTSYIDSRNYTEPMFVVIIMAIASTRPVIKLAENALSVFAGLGKHTPSAWWLSILIIAPLLGSFITEPAAMTIAALLLGQQFYNLNPSNKFKYATLGLLFVNISVGGTLTHFAAPPVLMVATAWEFDIAHMFFSFGIKAVLGVLIATGVYYFIFKSEFTAINERARMNDTEDTSDNTARTPKEEPVPVWIMLIHVLFIGWTVFTLHYPAFFIGGFLVFIAFTMATSHHQFDIQLKSPLLVGFFLAGLVTHGGLQGWWIAPVLGSLNELPLFIGATTLTAFNDNAAITFLASQVPAFDQHYAAGYGAEAIARAKELQYAVVAGAVTGGGLTVIANAPNPAGQSILSKYFGGGVNPLNLLISALIPTVILALCFLLIH